MVRLEQFSLFLVRLDEAMRLMTAPEFVQRNIRTLDEMAELARQFQTGIRRPETAGEARLTAIASDLDEAKHALPITLNLDSRATSLDALRRQLRRSPLFNPPFRV